MEQIRAIVVDDELEAREGVARLLSEHSDVRIIKICSNGVEAIEAIRLNEVDLMLLDIQMPGVDGFDVIRSIDPAKIPWIIFVTAHDQYTLKAFEVHAIDYLLKPFTDERFNNAIDRAKELITQKKDRDQFLAVTEKNVAGESQVVNSNLEEKMIIKENGKVIFVPHTEVIWIEAFDYYVKVHSKGQFNTVRTSMKKLESGLPEVFLRIHKSTIINKNHILSIQSQGNELTVSLSDGTERKVSRSYKNAVKSLS